MKILNRTSKDRFNCVKWVRNRVPNLPFGMWTIWNKKQIIDSQNAKIGRVAVITTNRIWGHLAIVTKAGKNVLTINEANWIKGAITERTGKKEDLKIIGFFNPQKKHWN